MTAIHWLNPISDSFTNPADWSGGAVPGAADDAIIDAVGAAPYTVTASAAETVSSLQTGAEATLLVSAGTFTAAAGTGSGGNAGIILVAGGATLAAAGQIANSGAIEIGSAFRGGALSVVGKTTLSGGGQLELDGSGNNRINGRPPRKQFAALYNLDNTISGSGTIGGATNFGMVNEAAGVIDANGANALVIENGIFNLGLMEATGAGGLTVNGGFTTNYGATISAGNGSVVRFENTRIKGGALESTGSGYMVGDGCYVQSIRNETTLSLNGYTELVSGFDNRSEINLNGGVVLNNFTLTGGGVVNLGGDISPRTSAVNFVNADNTIQGGGGIVGLVFTNEAAGVIDGNGSLALTVGSDGTPIANAGTIESTGANGLRVVDALDNSGLIMATAGTLTVGAAGVSYQLTNTGTISAAGGAVVVDVKVFGGGQASISAGMLAFGSAFNEAVAFTGTSGTLELARSQTYTKTISGFAKTGGTVLDLDDIGFVGSGEATFSGTNKGGVLTVTDGARTAKINLKGNYLTASFVASADGHGGVFVVAHRTPLSAPPGAPTHTFIAAMAALAPRAGEASRLFDRPPAHEAALARPRVEAA